MTTTMLLMVMMMMTTTTTTTMLLMVMMMMTTTTTTMLLMVMMMMMMVTVTVCIRWKDCTITSKCSWRLLDVVNPSKVASSNTCSITRPTTAVSGRCSSILSTSMESCQRNVLLSRGARRIHDDYAPSLITRFHRCFTFAPSLITRYHRCFTFAPSLITRFHRCFTHWTVMSVLVINTFDDIIFLQLYFYTFIFTSDKGGGKCFCPCSFVCLSVC